jgi:flagellin
MIINHNLMAMNTHRQLGINNTAGSKSLEKLSSGFRINRAGDDAAGLAISEKMRGQIRGLSQASRNAQDGISLIQTAEGALNETHSILQRMRELATQSATDTNTGVDRKEIQEEINQLAAEITRIADTTEFNTQNLLGGKFKAKFHIGANSSQNVDLEINNMDANALKVAGSGEGLATFEITASNVTGVASSALAVGEHELEVVALDNITMGDGTTIANYGLSNDKGEIVAVSQDGNDYVMLDAATKESKLATTTPLAAKITFADPVVSGQVKVTVAANATPGAIDLSGITATGSINTQGLKAGEYTVQAYAGELDATHVWTKSDGTTAHAVADTVTHVLVNADKEVVAVSEDGATFYAVEDLVTTYSQEEITDISAVLVSGAEAAFTSTTTLAANDKITIEANDGIDVSSQKAADKAITIINDALEAVSAERSKLGAMQNRLEHTIANLGTSAENLQAAESRIRDLDMAEEIMAFTKNNILQQAATAMLAQANQQPQSVLQLLR